MEFVIATVSDIENIFEFLQENFFPDEPLSATMKQNIGSAQSPFYYNYVIQNLSIIAKNKNNQIYGVAVNGVISVEDSLHQSEETKGGPIRQFLHKQSQIASLWTKIDDIKALETIILTTKKTERKQGIAGMLIERSLTLAKENHLNYAYIECSNIYTAKIAQKKGFQCIHHIDYVDYKNEDGEIVFNTKPPHDYFEIFFKKLQ